MLFVTHASYSRSAVQGFIKNPEDRRAAIDKLVESAGGKVVSLYMTSGDHDILLITEFDSGDAAVALGMVAAASGSIRGLKTVRAWTSAEFKGVAESAAALAGNYTPPGG